MISEYLTSVVVLRHPACQFRIITNIRAEYRRALEAGYVVVKEAA